jgi:hypothetical protein
MDLRIQGGGYATGSHDAQGLKRRQDYEALAKALNEGDMPGANQAYGAIIGQLAPGGRINPESFLGKMGVALRSADLDLARQLMSQGGPRNGLAVGAPGAEAAATQQAILSEGSPTLALNQAIQSGDQARASLALQAMIADLQQLASSGVGAAYGAARAYAAATPSAMAATSLLQNPNFRALEEAILRGDPTGMKAAWARLMSGSLETDKPRKRMEMDEEAETSASELWEMKTDPVS